MQHSTSSKMEAKEASHWVVQSLKLFPQANPPTPEFVQALVALICQYPRAISIRTLGELPVKVNYLPTLFEFKKELDENSSKEAKTVQYSEHVRRQLEDRNRFKGNPVKADYTGPIENVKPGDILTLERQKEYREFMAKNHGMQKVRLWGQSEVWVDSGARPFGRQEATKGKYKTMASIRETYPDFMQNILLGQDPDKPVFDPVKAKAELLAKSGVSEEAFAAIPDAKDYNWQTMSSTQPAKPISVKPEEPNPFE